MGLSTRFAPPETTQQTLCTQCGKPLSPYWTRRCEHCKTSIEIARPTPVWPVPTEDTDVRSYAGRSQEEAASYFGADAALMAAYGYQPVAQSWGQTRPGVGDIFALGPFAYGVVGSSGFLTVTYRRSPQGAAPQPAGAPSLSDRIRQLDDAHRAGLLTEDEYQRKRSQLIASF